MLLGPQFYDGVMLVAEAMKQAGSVEPAKYLPRLAAIRYSGVTADFAFAPNGNLLKAPVTLSVVKNNAWEVQTVVR